MMGIRSGLATFAAKAANQLAKHLPPMGVMVEANGTSYQTAYSMLGDNLNPSTFFQQAGRRTLMEQVREMDDADPELFGMMSTRRQAVLGFDRTITGEGPVADFVREVFAGFRNFDGTLFEMLASIPAGFSVSEVVWEPVDGKIVPIKLLPRYQDKFVFGKDWELKLQGSLVNEAVPVPPMKFLVTTYAGEYGNRYGSGIYQKVYWYWLFRKEAVRWWSMFTEKLVFPPMIGRLPKNNFAQDDADKLENFISGIRSNASVMLPEGFDIDLLEAEKSGTTTAYDSFIERMKSGMAIAILGQPGTTESGSVGSYARVCAQDQVRKDLMRSDISMLESVINDDLIKWIVDLNFPGVTEYPHWSINYQEKAPPQEQANVLEVLVRSGVKVPQAWAQEQFGIPVPQAGEETLSMTQFTSPLSGAMTFSERQFEAERTAFLREVKR
jgi:phage gp29-like protein